MTLSTNKLSSSWIPFVNNPINALFSFANDYKLQGSSPALTAATDGGEIGLYGGPNATFSLSGEPLNSPIVRDFTITNAAIPVNGNLDIDVTITKPLDEWFVAHRLQVI